MSAAATVFMNKSSIKDSLFGNADQYLAACQELPLTLSPFTS
jgi:hypothetical protein